ncbi:MAG: hypothetical protein B6I22_15070 [Desulfobacteraceae bacterium 4572_123]|nr:MAG: hypothetical protein B6I22_15070 [Desulfobacteraceae bacterium 4572_123]
MKKIYIISIITFYLLFFAGFPGVFEATAAHNTCRFKATNDDVYLKIFDKDSSGNTINCESFKMEQWKNLYRRIQPVQRKNRCRRFPFHLAEGKESA